VRSATREAARSDDPTFVTSPDRCVESADLHCNHDEQGCMSKEQCYKSYSYPVLFQTDAALSIHISAN